jgi:anti-sigma B factor antagonist
MSPVSVKETTVAGCPAFALSGELNIGSAPGVRDVFMKHIRKREPALLLDLSGLEFMDTSGLATLIEAHLKTERYGGKLILFGLKPRIAEVFEVTRVTALFSIFETQQDAVGALKVDAP